MHCDCAVFGDEIAQQTASQRVIEHRIRTIRDDDRTDRASTSRFRSRIRGQIGQNRPCSPDKIGESVSAGGSPLSGDRAGADVERSWHPNIPQCPELRRFRTSDNISVSPAAATRGFSGNCAAR